MNIYRTDLNLLAVFDCIYTQGSVTKASEVLHLTQPSVSYALSRLRDRLGDPLFVRQGKRLVPTPLAHQLIPSVRQALTLMESALSGLSEFDPTTDSSTLILGVRPQMESTFFPDLLSQVNLEAPNIDLFSVYFKRETLEKDLNSGNISVAIDVFLSLPDTIHRRHLNSSPLVVIGRRRHPAFEDGHLTLESYLQQRHLLISSRPQGHAVEDMLLARKGRRRKVVSRCQQISTGLEITRRSNLLMTVSKSMVNYQFLDDHEVRAAPFKGTDIDTYLYWHSGSEDNKANQWLRNKVEHYFSQALIN